MNHRGQKERAERPQGWERAQKQKNGIHSCFFECGRDFKSRDLAKAHEGVCDKREEVYEELKRMAERAGHVDGAFKDQDLGYASASAENSAQSSVVSSAAADREEKLLFVKYLKDLPRARLNFTEYPFKFV